MKRYLPAVFLGMMLNAPLSAASMHKEIQHYHQQDQ